MQVSCFIKPPSGKELNLARKLPISFGNWIAIHQRTARWQRSGVCRQCPRLEKKLHPSDGVASPKFYFPHRKVFRRPVTGHQDKKGRFHRSGPCHFTASAVIGSSGSRERRSVSVDGQGISGAMNSPPAQPALRRPLIMPSRVWTYIKSTRVVTPERIDSTHPCIAAACASSAVSACRT